MARNQMRAALLLRPLLALVAIAGSLTLAGCGGGSGAPNNPYAPTPPAPGPVFVLPASATTYANTPATLTVSGGATPYQAFSSNATVLPVTQSVNGSTVVLVPNNVAANTTAIVTVQDAIGQTATSTITVSPAPLLNTLTIVPARTTCGTNTVCSGDTATATVQVTGPGGAGIPNRSVRYDVVSGAFGILTNNPTTPTAPTLTVVSDNNGNARVIIQATVNAPTQPALLRATDITTGNTVTASFTIVQVTDGSAILSIVPSTATISGANSSVCSAGFRIDYYIYGGTPPYRVTSTFPTAITLSGSPVTTAGGAFTATTNGTCVDPLVFSIVDAVGRQTTATLINQVGTGTPPTPPAPTTLTVTGATTLTGCSPATNFQFAITGGTTPYNFSASSSSGTPVYNPANQQVTTNGGFFSVRGFATGSAPTLVVVDSGTTQQAVTKTLNCNP